MTQLTDEELHELISNEIGFSFMQDELQTVTAEELLRCARKAIAADRAKLAKEYEPTFYYRPVGDDGGYEGPYNAKSVLGQMLRDEKPREWKPLYTHPQPSEKCDPIGWINEDEPPSNYPYEAMFTYSKVDGVRLFPIFRPSSHQPSEDARDAERYRWLRDVSNDIEWPADGDWNDLGEAEGQEFDRIVDAAIAQQAAKEGE